MDTVKLPELLAPAGDRESLRAAVMGGADAVYFGAEKFNARMNARNFSPDEIRSAIDYCHSRGVRVYITLNTQLYDREMSEALSCVEELRMSGADGLICADIGLSSEIRKNFPDLPIHASTQMSLCDSEGVRFAAELGFSRAVVARELPLAEIKGIVEKSPIEIEIFVHGALCVCVSGQCLMSSVIGGRSGNRGECAQPCRMEYSSGGSRGKEYLLSLKDMCLASHITDLIGCGAASLKIEGRMKSPSYVYGVVSTYRNLLDERRNADKKDIERLASLFSRNGFTDGYFTGRISNAMNGMRSPSEKTPSVKQYDLSKPGDIGYDRKPVKPVLSDPGGTVAQEKLRSARFAYAGQIPDTDYFDIIYLPLESFDGKKANGVLLPPLFFDGESERVGALLEKAVAGGAEHIMLTNPGHIGFAEKYRGRAKLHLDFRFNANNSYSAKELVD
ncbi:MAG: U32 family peptidase, partial [Clostridia bacterium]|nr:U32 family peptidase [Clostridia bacterium]